MAPFFVDTVQPLSGEHERVLGLGHQDFLNSAPPRGQTFQGQSGTACGEGHHLQVEVITTQEPPVQGGELDDHLLAQTQRPAGVKEEAAQVLRLRREGTDRRRVCYM